MRISSHFITKPKGAKLPRKAAPPRDNMTLWYCQSAKDNYDGWEKEALPIGNGNMGAKIYGTVHSEHIQLNEKTIWSGTTLGVDGNGNGNANGDMGKSMREIQSLLLDGDYTKAAAEMPKLQGDETGLGAFQNFGDLFIDFTSFSKSTRTTEYIRDLKLKTAVSTVEFTAESQFYTREFFASNPADVICARFRGHSQNAVVRFNPGQKCTVACNNGQLIIDGEMAPGDNPLHFCAVIKVITDGKATESGSTFTVSGASDIKLIIAIKTDYAPVYPNYRSGVDVRKAAQETVENAAEKGYEQLKKEHIDDYKSLFDRCEINIGQTDHAIPTDYLLYKYKKGRLSRALEMMFFQYGRYLLISSSRDGGMPANLQGVWCAQKKPAWQSDYHLNINLQMNYWPAMSSNLAETAIPLIDYVNKCLVIPGRATAYKWVGIGDGDVAKATGWMAHTQNNLYGHTGTGSVWRWGWAPTAGAFILENTFEYYLFTKDIEKLAKDIYPAMEEAALMWSELLIEDKKNERLVCAPSFSPEHGPVSLGNTFDQELIYQLFHNVLIAARDLNDCGKSEILNQELLETIAVQIHKLKPHNIGKWGQIKEWIEEDDWKNRGKRLGVQKHHRHMSHLLGLYPGNSITSDKAAIMQAAATSLDDRGNQGQGWSKAQKIGAWARLFNGERAHLILEQQLKNNTYWNLWDTHPPFQIDGNFGATSGICEMLLQSHAGYIQLIPALPEFWQKSGSYKGLVARGNYEVSCRWENGKVVFAQIEAKTTGVIKIKINGKMSEVEISRDAPYIFEV